MSSVGLQSRQGLIEGVEARGRLQAIAALVPLAAMFGYTTDLRSASQGRGTFTMHFSHYAPVGSTIGRHRVADSQAALLGGLSRGTDSLRRVVTPQCASGSPTTLV